MPRGEEGGGGIKNFLRLGRYDRRICGRPTATIGRRRRTERRRRGMENSNRSLHRNQYGPIQNSQQEVP
jgi:hypothetical protein